MPCANGTRTYQWRSRTRGDTLLQLTGATGAAVCTATGVRTIGATPTGVQIAALVMWLGKHGAGGIFQTHALAALHPPAAEYAHVASGLLAMTLPRAIPSYVLWFRPEVVRTVTWAGDPTKAVESRETSARLHPRHSFEAWTQVVRGTSRPWRNAEVDAVEDLRRRAIEVDLSNQIARAEQAVLLRDELIAVVSHDLKSPLDVIAMAVTVLQPHVAADPRSATTVARVQRAVDRMKALIHDLLDLAKIESGRFDVTLVPCAIDQLVTDALSTDRSAGRIEGALSDVDQRRRPLGEGRPGTRASGPGKPGRQRDQVHARGRYRQHLHRSRQRRGTRGGSRYGPRNPRHRACAYLRSLLAGAARAQCGLRTWPLHRQGNRRSARPAPLGREHAGSGSDVLFRITATRCLRFQRLYVDGSVVGRWRDVPSSGSGLPYGQSRTRFAAMETSVSSQAAWSGDTGRAPRVTVCGATDIGLARPKNEDTFMIADLTSGQLSSPCIGTDLTVSSSGVLLLVCDGMGGHAAGEIASRVAANAIKEVLVSEGSTVKQHPVESMKHAVLDANQAVLDEARSNPSEQGMGTTCTAAIVLPTRLVIGQVGDSRAYLLRDGRLRALTRDQSLASQLQDMGLLDSEQARRSPYRNVLCRRWAKNARRAGHHGGRNPGGRPLDPLLGRIAWLRERRTDRRDCGDRPRPHRRRARLDQRGAGRGRAGQCHRAGSGVLAERKLARSNRALLPPMPAPHSVIL